MSLSSRLLRLSISVFLSILPSTCIAQVNPQFAQPEVQATGGHVTSFILGNFQQTQPSGSPDILYVNASTTTGTVTAGVLLGNTNHEFTNLTENQITFPNVLGVTPAVADFDGDGRPDFAFALAPVTIGGTNLCVYHGTGFSIGSGSSFGASICITFPTQPNTLSVFGYVVAAPFKSSQSTQQLFVEDTANNYIYVLANKGNLSGFTETAQIAVPATDGSGPIYTGDFNGDGNTDILINNQTSHKVTLYLGNGDGTFQPPTTVAVNVYSMLIHDMNGDGIPDLVTEVDSRTGIGMIEIQLGTGSNIPAPFGVGSVGGTSFSPTGLSGNGGHLAAIGKLGGDQNLDILTTTPIGLSVLLGQGGFQYQLKGIYNAGPGRSIFSLADFDGDGNLDLYLDSPEGIAVVLGGVDKNGSPIFQTSLAYPAGQPALNATIADVNSDGNPDVVVATGAIQSQILTGNGDGTFNAPSNTNTTVPNPQPGLWFTVLTGDFDGDGCPDLLYSLTGLPLPTPGSGAGSGLYLQYGNKPLGKCDGTFLAPQPISSQSANAPGDNNFYGGTAIGDFNGDGLPDIANIDTYYYDTLISQPTRGIFTLGTNIKKNANTFSQVAAGFFTTGRTNMQDLVFQDDANITPYVNKRDGSGTFTAMPPLANTPGVGTYYGGTILIADVDGDGNGDVIVPYHNLAASDLSNPSPSTPNLLYIWYGKGDGTFSAPQIITLSRNYYLAQAVDMNGDGLPDIILSDGYLVAILYNQGGRTFTNEQHFLAGQGINSISVADVDNDGSVDLIIANGGATISNAVAIGGKTLPAISLTPNPDVNTGGVTVLLNSVKTRPVTGSVISSPNPSRYQEAFGLSVDLSATQLLAPIGGTVTFLIDGIPVGTPALTGGGSVASASLMIPAGNTYQGGTTHQIEASYSGDAFNSPMNFFTTQTITGSATTTTLYLCTGPNPTCPSTGTPPVPNPPYPTSLSMSYGQIFNGVTSAVANDNSLLTGTIALNDAYNGAPPVTICTLPVGVGSECPANVGTVGLGTGGGTNVLTAVYSGDATHASSTSPAVTITVSPDTNTATLTGSPNPSPQGQPVTFTATFTGNFTAPTGTVTFAEFFPPTTVGTLLGPPVTLVPSTGLTSTATFPISTLPVGADTISVSYAANLDFNSATATIIETITPAIATTTTLTSSQNPSIFSKPVTFTATVSQIPGPGGPVIIPTGTVTFLDGTTILGTGTLSNGVAAFTTSTLTVGSHAITAIASGDSFTAPSTSAVLTQIVDPLPPPGSKNFTITVTPSPITVGVGNASALTVTITPLNGFTQPVALSCSNLPPESACTFVIPTIPGGGGSTNLLISTMAPHNCGSTQPYFTGSNTHPDLAPFAVPMLAGLAVIFIPGKRRWLRALIAMVAIAGAMQITGCGTCTDLGTRPNTYTIQIAGTATGTAEVESQPVILNVTI